MIEPSFCNFSLVTIRKLDKVQNILLNLKKYINI